MIVYKHNLIHINININNELNYQNNRNNIETYFDRLLFETCNYYVYSDMFDNNAFILNY